MDCGSAPAEPRVEGGGCDQLCPLRAPPCPAPRVPSRKAGGRWEEKEGSAECPAATPAVPDDSRHLGVPTPPTRSGREACGGRGQRETGQM